MYYMLAPILQEEGAFFQSTASCAPSASHFKIAGDLKIDRTGTSKRALHNQFPYVMWTLGWPDVII